MIAQKIKKQYSSPIEKAIKYYSILSVLNNIGWTDREIQLLSFASVKGNISSGGAKQQFIDTYKTSKATIGNVICKLYKQNYLIKEDGRVFINPILKLDFTEDLLLQVHICQ